MQDCEDADACPPVLPSGGSISFNYTIRNVSAGSCFCDDTNTCSLETGCVIDIDVNVPVFPGRSIKLAGGGCVSGSGATAKHTVNISGCGSIAQITIKEYSNTSCTGTPSAESVLIISCPNPFCGNYECP
jgi:hypothetical protein